MAQERPISFTSPMVRATLADLKTQTRRVVDEWTPEKKCRYGVPGDRLWVREAWYDRYDGLDSSTFDGYVADGEKETGPVPATTDEPVTSGYRAKISPIFMPRRLSRITLEITGIRTQRVQEISEEDAKAEGVQVVDPVRLAALADDPEKWKEAYRLVFASYWDRLNAKRGYPWASNPWVWVIEFRRIK